MAWPTDTVTNANLDQTTDDPSLARAELKNALDVLKLVLAEVSVGATIWHSGNLAKASDGAKLDNFKSATSMLFRNTTAPVGWTKVLNYNNYALRIVTGTISLGGTIDFSTAFTNRTSTAVTLTSAQSGSPAHAHTIPANQTPEERLSGGNIFQAQTQTTASPNTFATMIHGKGATGATNNSTGVNAASGHTHNLDLSVKYIDMIIADKNA